MESKVRVIVRIRPFLNDEDPNTRCVTVNRKELLELNSSIVQKTCYKYDKRILIFHKSSQFTFINIYFPLSFSKI